MEPTRFAAILDVDAIYHPILVLALPFVGTCGYCSNAGEDQGVGRGRARSRTADPMIIRVAEREFLVLPAIEVSAGTFLGVFSATTQASAKEGVEERFGCGGPACADSVE